MELLSIASFPLYGEWGRRFARNPAFLKKRNQTHALQAVSDHVGLLVISGELNLLRAFLAVGIARKKSYRYESESIGRK